MDTKRVIYTKQIETKKATKDSYIPFTGEIYHISFCKKDTSELLKYYSSSGCVAIWKASTTPLSKGDVKLMENRVTTT